MNKKQLRTATQYVNRHKAFIGMMTVDDYFYYYMNFAGASHLTRDQFVDFLRDRGITASVGDNGIPIVNYAPL